MQHIFLVILCVVLIICLALIGYNIAYPDVYQVECYDNGQLVFNGFVYANMPGATARLYDTGEIVTLPDDACTWTKVKK